MKTSVAAFLSTVLLAAAAAPAFAIDPSRPATVGPVGPAALGDWRGTVKTIDPHQGPDGRYFTYRYIEVVGATQALCQQQLNALDAQPNVSVHEFCEFHPW